MASLKLTLYRNVRVIVSKARSGLQMLLVVPTVPLDLGDATNPQGPPSRFQPIQILQALLNYYHLNERSFLPTHSQKWSLHPLCLSILPYNYIYFDMCLVARAYVHSRQKPCSRHLSTSTSHTVNAQYILRGECSHINALYKYI